MTVILLALGCAPTPAPRPEVPVPTVGARESVEAEVSSIEQRLQADEGGRLLLRAIDAHGGLTPWLQAGTLQFDFDYAPVGEPGARRYARTTVDIQSRRAFQQELGEGADATMGWDGQEAWIEPSTDAFPSDPRFWATTPFYFVGLPWVLADEGVQLEVLEERVVPETGVDAPLPTLRATFEPGTGDAPDDFYVLHLHPEDGRVLAVRYIVTYPDFFPDGGHSPEKVLLWSAHARSDGLLFARRYASHLWEDGVQPAKKVDVRVDHIVLGETVPVSRFSRP